MVWGAAHPGNPLADPMATPFSLNSKTWLDVLPYGVSDTNVTRASSSLVSGWRTKSSSDRLRANAA